MTTFNINQDPITSIKEYTIDENGKRVLSKVIKEKSKSAYDLTDEEVIKVVDPCLDVSDFNDDGSDIDTLRDILEGNKWLIILLK